MTYYHYACTHSAAKIGSPGTLLPAWQHTPESRDIPQSRWLWLTDLAAPDGPGLGLLGMFSKCDRTERRYEITEHGLVVPYWQVARTLPPGIREGLEVSYGALPRHWFVTEDPAVGVLSDLRERVAP